MTARPIGEPDAACPPRFNMAAYCIASSATARADATALCVFAGGGPDFAVRSWTYRELSDAVGGIAAGLARLDLHRGDRIIVALPNSPEYAFTVFAAIAAGLIAVPVSPALTPREVAAIAADCGAAAIALDDGATGTSIELPPHIHMIDRTTISADAAAGARLRACDTAADDPAYIVYTSGTTSRPKGVLHAHRAAWGRRPMYHGWYGITPADRMLHAGAFNWTFTLGTGLTDPWAVGACAIVHVGDKTPALWPLLIRASRATLFAAVPGVYRQILKSSASERIDLGALRHGLMAGEKPQPGLVAEWQQRTGTGLYEALGMSELSTFISASPTIGWREGRAGKAQPGRRVAILPAAGGTTPLPPGQEGLIAVDRRDAGLMLGYWQRADEETAVFRGDWFVGGDLGVMDGDGWIEHRGRADDIMKPLGYRVAPQEIEAVLASHAAVAEAACTEVEVKAGVRLILAALVLREGATPPGEVELREHAAARLAAYKVPHLYRVLDALPRTANGKVMRKALTASDGVAL
ncbi:MAG: class I adenylate-forming enzyme family protein [Hyphomicrobiaceae bacterium]|nr:class I adenylate-forming enzyme family protein [Hyphomicrobiaceae bacterium]